MTKFLYFREVNMPGGRKPKPNRGRPAETVDPKLTKVVRRKVLNKLSNQRKQDSDEEKEERRRGRPPLTPATPMNRSQLKERMKTLNKEKRKEILEEAKQQTLAEKRRVAANARWKKNREKSKVHGVERCTEEVRSLLPPSFSGQLDLLSLLVPSFPECALTSSKPGLSQREGKSWMYEKLKSVKACLSSCPLANQILLSLACELALLDYDLFLSHGLAFKEQKDVPVLLLMRQASEKIKVEVWGESRRENVRHLTLDHAIRVFKVGK